MECIHGSDALSFISPGEQAPATLDKMGCPFLYGALYSYRKAGFPNRSRPKTRDAPFSDFKDVANPFHGHFPKGEENTPGVNICWGGTIRWSRQLTGNPKGAPWVRAACPCRWCSGRARGGETKPSVKWHCHYRGSQASLEGGSSEAPVEWSTAGKKALPASLLCSLSLALYIPSKKSGPPTLSATPNPRPAS